MNRPEDLMLAEAIDQRGLDQALVGKESLRLALEHGGLTIELREADDCVLLCFARADDGGLAMRLPKILLGAEWRFQRGRGASLAVWSASGAEGVVSGVLEGDCGGAARFRCQLTFTPRRPIRLPYLPRDLIVYGRDGQSNGTRGKVEATQRRLNTGMCYFSAERPALGKVFYAQDLTALNPYFAATGTKPENVVGGEWPLLGYLAPTKPGDAKAALAAGEAITLYDSHLNIRQFVESEESDSAWQFLDMLGDYYRAIEKPAVERRGWVERAELTLRDLELAPNVRTWHFGQLYFHPYTGAENPDSMVQLALASAINDWNIWSGRKHPLYARIMRGLDRFHDRKLKALRRYLPDVDKDKNADAVDSWYLYHPLLNLANLAITGDERARDLFLKTIDYGIRAARHFAYKWPIEFNARTFVVLKPVAPADQRGQTDVGGVYAWVMLQAFELTSEKRFLDEAEAALEAARGMRFNLNYQANLTAWGAAACIRLWRITNRKTYLALSYAYLASFFHNSQIWESEIGHAVHYSNFLGVTCLQDAPYMAAYECYDSFAAFERYLDLAGPDVIPAARMLVSEYCRYALHRAWSYYPDALPAEVLATEYRNGTIDRGLSLPVEDLYPDGQPAGQVGQEVYGAGGAMIFATRAFHQIEGAPFRVYCDHFMRALTRIDARSVSFKLEGEEGTSACLALVRSGRARLPEAILRRPDGEEVTPTASSRDSIEFEIPSHSTLVLAW